MKRYVRAFTLLELIIVIMVLGILASLALPFYIRVAEKTRTTEAKVSLATIRSAQIRYHASHDGTGYAIDLSQLDVELGSKYFILGAGLGTEANCGNATRNTSAEWKGGTPYTLTIDIDGTLSIDPVEYEYLL